MPGRDGSQRKINSRVPYLKRCRLLGLLRKQTRKTNQQVASQPDGAQISASGHTQAFVNDIVTHSTHIVPPLDNLNDVTTSDSDIDVGGPNSDSYAVHTPLIVMNVGVTVCLRNSLLCNLDIK